ncbi:hypothetical protein J6590_099808 [Homalodisca vitripennis]|nr:hypothetical protein J6590_099808 [Homalodisca vitripennis]
MYAGHHDERRRSPVQETKPDSDKLCCDKEVTGGSMYAGHHDERRRSPVQETKPDSDELRCGKGIIELIQCKAAAYDRMRTWWVCQK